MTTETYVLIYESVFINLEQPFFDLKTWNNLPSFAGKTLYPWVTFNESGSFRP